MRCAKSLYKWGARKTVNNTSISERTRAFRPYLFIKLSWRDVMILKLKIVYL
jgi:hypothetical protein